MNKKTRIELFYFNTAKLFFYGALIESFLPFYLYYLTISIPFSVAFRQGIPAPPDVLSNRAGFQV